MFHLDYLLKAKSNALQVLTNLKTQVEQQLGLPIKDIQTE